MRERERERETEREEKFGQNCIAQTKLEVRQSIGRTRTGRQVFSRHTKKTQREKPQHSCRPDQWGMLD